MTDENAIIAVDIDNIILIKDTNSKNITISEEEILIHNAIILDMNYRGSNIIEFYILKIFKTLLRRSKDLDESFKKNER